MRAVLQRVSRAQVEVDGQTTARINNGLLILLGVTHTDRQENAEKLARKCAHLRIFPDAEEKMNLSLLDVKGSAIVVSQFTLYADTRKGLRPAFIDAAQPEIASPLVDYFTNCLRGMGIDTGQGVFGAHMKVELVNDGPVTIILEM